MIAGCRQNVKNDLITKVDRQCGDKPKGSCIVNLKDVTDFKWDRMYIFPNWTSSDTISKITGLNYTGNDVEDQYYRMLFVSRNAVVHEEDNKDLDYYNSSIEFLGTDTTDLNGNGYSLTYSQAVFTVIKGKIEGACPKCFLYSFSAVEKGH